MRSAVLLMILPVLASTGCSMLIAGAGTDLTHLETREEVRKQFGEPIATGAEGEVQFEKFRSRQKYAEEHRSATHSMGLGMTMGLVELYLFPRELYLLAKRSVFGQEIRVTYKTDGSIKNIRIDGFPFWFGDKPGETRWVKVPPE